MSLVLCPSNIPIHQVFLHSVTFCVVERGNQTIRRGWDYSKGWAGLTREAHDARPRNGPGGVEWSTRPDAPDHWLPSEDSEDYWVFVLEFDRELCKSRNLVR